MIIKLIFRIKESPKAIFDLWAYMDTSPVIGAVFKENDFESYPIVFRN